MGGGYLQFREGALLPNLREPCLTERGRQRMGTGLGASSDFSKEVLQSSTRNPGSTRSLAAACQETSMGYCNSGWRSASLHITRASLFLPHGG